MLAEASAGEVASAGRWALVIALAVLVIGVPLVLSLLGWFFSLFSTGGQHRSFWWGGSLLVGADKRLSTSKTMAVIWTYSVAAALLSFLIARWLGHPRAFNVLKTQGLDAQYAVLIGGPLGAAILAKGIVSSQVSNGSAAKPPATDRANPAQLAQNDAGEADLGDVQYLLFNLVALIFFYGEILRLPQRGMPTIPDVLVGLTSVSAVGFVGKKALAGPAGISNVEPQEAHVGDQVTISTAGIIQAADDLNGVTVKFGGVAVSPGRVTMRTTTSFGVLLISEVPLGAVGDVEVTVSVPTGTPSRWPGFKVLPRISETEPLAGSPGGTLLVRTSGVTGMGPGLPPNLGVTIDGAIADAKFVDMTELRVTIPPAVRAGEAKLVLTPPGGRAIEADITIHPPQRAANGRVQDEGAVRAADVAR